MKGRNLPFFAYATLLAIALPTTGAWAAGKPPAPAHAPETVTFAAHGEHVSHGRFKDLAVYKPQSAAKAFVLFLSGDGGWNAATERIALELAERGAMVTGIDTNRLKENLAADPAGCVFPDGDLENLSHFVQAYYHDPAYLKPLLVGIESGASLAYAMLVQAPRDTFGGALTLDFCPQFELSKPLCKGSGLEFDAKAGGRSVTWLPAPRLGNPWVDLQAAQGNCPVPATREFIAKIQGAAGVTLPPVNTDASLLAAFGKLRDATSAARDAPPPAVLGDLPVVEVPAQPGQPDTDLFAILMSGDGGWAGIDQAIAAALTAKGIPVVGLDSLRYFWTARTPDGIGADTDRLIRYYLAHLRKKRVLLIGYSQGADVLPFAVNRLPATTRSSVALTAILGMSEHALFEFHVASWVSDDDSGPATMPEVERITGAPVLCIYGQDENDSLCPKLNPKKVDVVKVKGGHHFDGNYTELAGYILSAAK
jgi:type IV secretory pathway VirJ component